MLSPAWGNTRFLPRGLSILHEDSDILVVDKPAGLLSVNDPRSDSRSAFSAIRDYLRKGNSKSTRKLYVVHRLDRESSGVLVFAKTETVMRTLQEGWHSSTEKTYLAIVWGHFDKPEGCISSYLVEQSSLRVRSNKKSGKLSHTEYSVQKQTPRYSLVKINLLTGRKHQIRVHMAEAGHPIIGDKRYGEKDRAHPRLGLHASAISFPHPTGGERITISAKTPNYFFKQVGVF